MNQVPRREVECAVAGCESLSIARRFVCQRHHSISLKYGISDMQIVSLLSGKCDACGREAAQHIDHDHACCPGEKSCGKCVRGALCRECNLALGMVHDSKDRLLALVNYLS